MDLAGLLHSRKRIAIVRSGTVGYALLLIALLGLASRALAATASSVTPAGSGTARAAATKSLQRLPLRFEGTADGQAMAAHLGDHQLRLGKAGAIESRSATGQVLTITLEGANQEAIPVGQAQLPGRSNYFLGRDPSKWRKGVEQFSQARVRDVYDGIDLRYYGSGSELEHDYILAPGSDPARIRMRISGGKSRIDGGTGDLIVSQGDANHESMRLLRPVAYQLNADGLRRPVEARYAQNANGSVGFTLGEYDHALLLTIDPVVTYSTYFGGSNNDEVNDIKTDAAGNLVLLVATSSTDLPAISQIPNTCVGTCGPTNPSPQSSPRIYDFYVAKLDPSGQTLLYSTYIGGTGDDYPGSLVIAPDGTLYIAGTSDSLDFPVVNGYPSTIPDYRYYNSATLTKLSADGSTILYSSLIGAGLVDSFENSGYSSAPGSLAVGTNGIAYLIGSACCGQASFLDAKNATFTAGGGSFVAKFDTTKSGNDSLLYATTFGQPGDTGGENLQAIAIDSKQDLWVVGYAYASYASKPIPTSDAVQPICDGGGQCGNAFIHGLTPAGAIFYTSFLGGTKNSGGGPGFETPADIVIDSSDNIYVSGTTESIDFPLENAAFTTYDSESTSNFLTKLSPGGKSILYSTYTPNMYFLATLPEGVIAAVGNGTVPQVNAIPPNAAQLYPDVAFEVFDTTKSGMDSLLISSYLGSLAHENPQAASVDAQGNLLIAGITGANPILVNPYQSTCTNCGFPYGISKGFVTRVQLTSGSLTLTPTTQSFPDTPSGSSSPTQTSTLTNTTSATITLSTGTLTDATDFSASDNCNSTIPSGASCTVTFTFTPRSAGALTSTYSINDVNNPTSPLIVALSGTGTAPPAPQASLTPSSADFGSIAAGSTSPAQTFTLSNTGNAALPVTSAALAGANAGSFTIAGNNCGTSLVAGGSCKLAVTFSPAAAGTDAAMLNITDSIGTQTAALTGTSFAAAPKATVTPASVDFGRLTLGSALNPQTITLVNTGNTALPFTSFAITGTNASSFQVRNGACPKSLAAGATCPIDVIFTPTTAGTAVAALSFTDSLGTQSAALTGKAVYASATLVPAPGTSNNFGNVTVGAQAGAAIRLNNTSQAPITVTGASITGTAFKLDSSGSCAAPVPSNGLCEVSVFFDPTTVGPASGTLSITTDIAGVLTLPFTGTGVPTTATLTPSTYGFGSIQVGASSGLITFLLTNTSPVPIKLIGSSVTGSGFHLAAKAGTLAPGSSAKYLVAFKPTAVGAATGTLSVISDAGTATSTLTGTGIAPQATLTPSTADFGNITVGGTSTNHAFTLTNAGSAPLSITSVGITGPSAASFLLGENQCVTSLPAGGSCLLGVTILPTSVGQAGATLSVVDSVGTQSATLTANGILPTLTITPPSIDFGAVTVGTTVSKTLTYTNTSPVSILFKGQSEAGDLDGAINEAAGGTCTAASTGLDLRAGGSCTFTFTFTPTAASNYSGTLSYFDTAGTQTISFTGHGVLPTLTVTPTTLAYGNVPVGTTVDQTVTFTNSSTVPITFTGNATPSGDFGTIFSPTLTNTCAGNAIAAGASCTIGFSFTPTAPASYSGALAFSDTAGAQTLTFTGTGTVPPAPKLVLTPTTYSFGAVPAGSIPTETVTLTNAGTEEANFVYGASVVSNGLQIAATGNTCQTTLAPGASCAIPVQLTGADTGSAQFTIDIAGNSGTNSVAASLIGFGAAGGPPPTFIDLGNGFTTGALTFNGSVIASNGILQLTANQPGEASSAFYTTPVSASTFSTDFAFQLLDPLAEGLTFTIQANTPNAIGTGGGGLGYQGIAKSIALKLDLRDTAGEGDNSTGIYVNGAAPTVPSTPLAGSGIDLHSGHVFILHSDYDGTTESIILTDTATQAVWKTQAAEDIPTLLGSDIAYFGFTASTAATTAAPDTDIATAKPSARPLDAAAIPTTTTNILDWTYTTAPAPAILTPASLDFGNITVGSTSRLQTAQLINTGTGPFTIASITVSDPIQGRFGEANNPGIGLRNSFCSEAVAPTNYCKLEVTLAPRVVGAYSGNVVIKYYLGDGSLPSENFTATLQITGNGVAPAQPTATLTGINFGNVAVGSSSTSQAVLTNTGTVPLTIGHFSPFQENPFYEEGFTCGGTLAVGQSCEIDILFHPLTAGPSKTSLSYGTGAGTLVATVTGNAVAPAKPTATFTGINFGNVTVGSSATSQAVLTNTGTVPLTIGHFSPFQENPFYEEGFTCGGTLAVGQSCEIDILFHPLTAGPSETSLSYVTGAGTLVATLTGNAVAPAKPTATFTGINFGSVTVGSSATSQAVLTNTGTVPLTIGHFSPFQENPFYEEGFTCGGTLAVGQSCEIDILFHPLTAGPSETSLSYVTGAGTLVATVTGNGVAPADFTVTTTKANLTVIRGSSADLVIDLGPSTSNPFTAPVTFTASGLPAGATATFAPSTLVPGTGSSTTMTVSVPALASHNRPISPFPPGGRNAAFGISAAALLAGLFGFRRRLNPRLLLCLCALGLIGAITGCGSGAGFTIPTTNSNFTVTATSGSITHTISVTLTVQ